MKQAWAYFQKALYSKLANSAAVMAMVRGVGDWPNPQTPLPYITLGDDTEKEWRTKTAGGHEIEASVHIWSGAFGNYQAKQIADAVAELLTGEQITLDAASGYIQIDKARRFGNSVTLREENGKIVHIVLPFRFYLREQG